MKKCILFGCGQIGKVAYQKLTENYNIIACSDNNANLWGENFFYTEIISPEKIKELQETSNADVVVTIDKYEEVCNQLLALKIINIIVWKQELLYHYDKEGFIYPISGVELSVFHKHDLKDFHVLFVQTIACIRTHKIAKALTTKGIKVSLAYLETSPKQSNSEYADVYVDVYPIYTFGDLIKFVNKSEFDIVHSSNEPDLLTALLTQSSKTIIHDCHDLSSAYKSMTPEELMFEFLANKNSSGVIYTTNGIREEALRKFQITRDKTFVLENLISEELRPSIKCEKLSTKDKELHCVYEGGVIGGDPESHRYFEEIWKQIASSGVHVHFYTHCNEEYCKRLEKLNSKIHYEGNVSSHQLAVEMTKFDVGLCILNVTDKNRQYLEYASPNKIQEYINAGIPVATGDIKSQQDFVEKNGFGKRIDMTGDIARQLSDISKIKIRDNILHDKGLTLENKIPELIEFYKNCMG